MWLPTEMRPYRASLGDCGPPCSGCRRSRSPALRIYNRSEASIAESGRRESACPALTSGPVSSNVDGRFRGSLPPADWQLTRNRIGDWMDPVHWRSQRAPGRNTPAEADDPLSPRWGWVDDIESPISVRTGTALSGVLPWICPGPVPWVCPLLAWCLPAYSRARVPV